MNGLELFGVFTGRQILNDFGFTYKMTLVPNAKYELWCVGSFVQKVINVKSRIEIK